MATPSYSAVNDVEIQILRDTLACVDWSMFGARSRWMKTDALAALARLEAGRDREGNLLVALDPSAEDWKPHCFECKKQLAWDELTLVAAARYGDDEPDCLLPVHRSDCP